MTDRTAELVWSQAGNTATGTLQKTDTPKAFTFDKPPGGGGAQMKSTKPLPWPGKAQAQNMANWKTLASPAAMAKAIRSPGAIVPLLIGTGLAALMEAACTRVAGGTMQLADGAEWEECNMVQRETQMWRTGADSRTVASSPEASCELFKNVTPQGASFVVRPDRRFCFVYASNGAYINGVGIDPYGTQTVEVQEGWKETAPEIAEQKLRERLAADCAAGASNSNCENTLKDLIERGATVDLPDPTITGPASVPRNPLTKTETETNPTTGQPRTKTTTTTQTNNYTYEDNRVTNNITTVTTVTYSDGTPSETTEETETDERTFCERNPDDDECREDGDRNVPEGEIPKSSKALTYAAEVLGFGGGSCPPDVVQNLGGKPVTVFSYVKGCELLANYVKPLILALSAWIAFVILMPGAREGTA